jgi:hypothetical protein
MKPLGHSLSCRVFHALREPLALYLEVVFGAEHSMTSFPGLYSE